MKSLREFKAILQLAEKRGDIQTCITLCRQALPLTAKKDVKGFYAVRIKLSAYLLASGEAPPSSSDVEESFSLFKELEAVIQRDDAVKWGHVQYNLGWLYSIRSCGIPSENLKDALVHLENATEVLTQQAFPNEWANIQMLIAEVCASEIWNNQSLILEKGLKALQNASNIYTKADFPDDYEHIQEGIKEYTEKLESSHSG